jgi:hypothetical protein
VGGQGVATLPAPVYPNPYLLPASTADSSFLLHRAFPTPAATLFTTSVLGTGRSGTVLGTGRTPWRELEGEGEGVPCAIKVRA